jgi:hypothetical protein
MLNLVQHPSGKRVLVFQLSAQGREMDPETSSG